MSTTTHDDTKTSFKEFITKALGFTPEDSLVVFPVATSGLIARIDLDPLVNGTELGLLSQTARHISEEGSTEVVVAYFTERSPATLAAPDARLTAALTRAGLTRHTTLMFDNAPQGTRRHELGVIPSATPRERSSARRACRAATPRLSHYVAALTCLTNGDRPSASMLGRAAATLESVALRDAIVVWMTDPSLDLGDSPSSLPGDDVTLQAMDKLLKPKVGQKPSRTVEDHVELLTLIAAHMDREAQAPARTLLAFIAWWSGNGGLAARHLEEALSADPKYRFAVLLACVLDRAIPPGWAA